jgi:hypothetical protein
MIVTTDQIGRMPQRLPLRQDSSHRFIGCTGPSSHDYRPIWIRKASLHYGNHKKIISLHYGPISCLHGNVDEEVGRMCMDESLDQSELDDPVLLSAAARLAEAISLLDRCGARVAAAHAQNALDAIISSRKEGGVGPC